MSQCLIQLAKAEGAKTILATAGTDEKTKLCEKLGATKGINYKKSDWAEEVKKLAPTGVDLIVDFIIGTNLPLHPRFPRICGVYELTWCRPGLFQEGSRSNGSRCHNSLSSIDGRKTN